MAKKQPLAGFPFPNSACCHSFVSDFKQTSIMRKFGFILMCSCLLGISAFAQQVSGSVKDQTGKTLSGTTVSLLKAKDSAVLKLAVSNADG